MKFYKINKNIIIGWFDTGLFILTSADNNPWSFKNPFFIEYEILNMFYEFIQYLDYEYNTEQQYHTDIMYYELF